MITSLDRETITRFLQSDQGKDFARESDQYPYIVYRKGNWVISVNYGAPNLSKFLFHTRMDGAFKAFSTDDFAEILRQMQIKPFTPPPLDAIPYLDVLGVANSINNFTLGLMIGIVRIRDRICGDSKSHFLKKVGIAAFVGLGMWFLMALSLIETVGRTIASLICSLLPFAKSFSAKYFDLAPATCGRIFSIGCRATIKTWKVQSKVFTERDPMQVDELVRLTEAKKRAFSTPYGYFEKYKRAGELVQNSWVGRL